MREKRTRETPKKVASSADVISLGLDSDVSEPIVALKDSGKRNKRITSLLAESMEKEKNKVLHVEPAAAARPAKKRKSSQANKEKSSDMDAKMVDEAGPSNRAHGQPDDVAPAAEPSVKTNICPTRRMSEKEKKAIVKKNSKYGAAMKHEFKDPEMARYAAILRARYEEIMKDSITVDIATGSVVGPRPKGLELRGGKKVAWIRDADGTCRPIHIREVAFDLTD